MTVYIFLALRLLISLTVNPTPLKSYTFVTKSMDSSCLKQPLKNSASLNQTSHKHQTLVQSIASIQIVITLLFSPNVVVHDDQNARPFLTSYRSLRPSNTESNSNNGSNTIFLGVPLTSAHIKNYKPCRENHSLSPSTMNTPPSLYTNLSLFHITGNLM